MRKCFAVVFPITFFVVTLSVWAGDFWEMKKFANWSEKEVRKMLTKSPWTRTATMSVGSLLDSLGGQVMTAEDQLRRREASDADARQEGADGGVDVFLGGPAREVRGQASRPSRFRPMITLTIRWESALPIKQAVVRTRFGSQGETSKQATDLLKKQESHYVIGVSGVPFPMVVKHSELADTDSQESPPIRERLQEIFDRAKSHSFLRINSRDPIAAEAMRVQEDRAQNVVNAEALQSEAEADIYFMFPRHRDGEELITLREKEVEFVTQIGPLKVERKFKLKDMVYNGKLEL